MVKIYAIGSKKPRIDPNVAFIADSVIIIGDVRIGEGCTIFDNVVLEGHPAKIKIGKNTNIQSGTVIHGLIDSPTKIGDYVTIGHRCIIHGAKIGDYATVGMGSLVMGYSKIGEGAYLGAGSFLPEKKRIPPKTMAYGHPAKMIKELDEKAVEYAKSIAEYYVEEGQTLKNKLELIKDISEIE